MSANERAERAIHPVLLSGGSGTRLWPLSRTLYPKQLLPLVGETSLFQQTAERFRAPGFAPPLVICNEEHRFIVAEQLRVLGVEPARIVLEPVGRNTAPAAAIAALLLFEQDPGALMLVAPSDHVIADVEALRRAIESAASVAADGHLVTFGVKPDSPHTGYGYIERGAPIADGPCLAVARFVEKPDRATAERYLQSGGYLWNSGMFLFGAAQFLAELERRNGPMVEACRAALAAAREDFGFLRLGVEPFTRIAGDSIDYAVMEQARDAAVMPIDVGWSDLGSWRALWETGARDRDGNVLQGDVLALESRGLYMRSEGPLVAAVGVEDLVIVATGDAVLVASKDNAEAVREVVRLLAEQGRSESDSHARVVRPWGAFEGVKAGPGYQVKLLTVNPGASISLQYHNHRAEHWVVVGGNARVTCGETVRDLYANESTYIPRGERHRLENPGEAPLSVVEVQTGEYLGEDDIVRLEDRYNRG